MFSLLNNLKPYLLFFAFLGLFIFLRLYHLPQTLNMFGDLARDFLELHEWQQTGLPPLLGPQNSAISFNQSAIYFYLLYPFYLITGSSAYATTIAGVVYYLVGFMLLWKHYSSKPALKNKISLLVLLMAIWPTLVYQQRKIWNPSFVPLAILIAFFSWQKWLSTSNSKVANWLSWLSAFGLSLAVALNFASIPTAAVLTAMILFSILSKQRLKFILKLIFTSFILNLPTLVFEIRHNFFLLKKLPSQELLQVSNSLFIKSQQYITHLFKIGNWSLGALMLILIILSVMIFKNGLQTIKTKQPEFFYSLTAFLASTALILLAPFQIHAHYVVATLTLLLIALSFTPKINWLLVLVMAVVYLQPKFVLNYLKPTPVSITQKRACVIKICDRYQQPIFFNLNSPSHNHQALGYIYLGKEIGCPAVAVNEYELHRPNLMAVFNERAEYVPQKTDYYEISLFGPKEQIEEIDCGSNLNATVFKQSSN